MIKVNKSHVGITTTDDIELGGEMVQLLWHLLNSKQQVLRAVLTAFIEILDDEYKL